MHRNTGYNFCVGMMGEKEHILHINRSNIPLLQYSNLPLGCNV